MEDKLKEIVIFFVLVIMLQSCSNDNSHYFENSKKIQKGMGINDVVKTMNGSPNRIFDIENKATDKTLRLEFLYYDKKEDWEIFITFNDSLKVVMVGHDD